MVFPIVRCFLPATSVRDRSKVESATSNARIHLVSCRYERYQRDSYSSPMQAWK